MSFDDWILALHVLSAFALVGAMTLFWILIVAMRNVDTVAETFAFGRVAKLGNVVVIAARNSSASILVARSPDVGVDCLAIAREAASLLGGGAGGAADFAQGGGTKVEGVDAAFGAAIAAVRDSLG